VINRNELYAERMYDSFIEHASKCKVCVKAAPGYKTTSLCNIGKARAISWEQAENLVAREARRAPAPDVEAPAAPAIMPDQSAVRRDAGDPEA
jgi:hypothetical protein